MPIPETISQSLALTQVVKVRKKKANSRPLMFGAVDNQFNVFALPTLPKTSTDTESVPQSLTLSQSAARATTLKRTIAQSLSLAQVADHPWPTRNSLSLSQSATDGYVPATPSVITNLPVGDPTGQMPNMVVRDTSNSFDLYTRNANTVHNAPASTTKLMTILLTWEYQNTVWTNTVTVTAADITQPYAGITLSSAGLQANDVISWQDLVYCMVLPSGFDACQCAARIIGDALYAAAGNTGTQGMTRFIERMNARAVELGMTNATYFDSVGGSFSSGVTRNTISARDLNTITRTAFAVATLRTIGGTVTRSATITGVNARSLSLAHTSHLVNGPTITPANIKDTNVLAAKTGEWSVSGLVSFSHGLVYNTPSGYEVTIATLGSQTQFGMMLDLKGIIYALFRDFPYLFRTASVGTDPSFSSVKLLVGADGSIVDESSNARSVSSTTVTVGSPVIEGTGSINVSSNGSSDVHVADAADLVIGSGDFTSELWYSGPGSAPSNGVEYLFSGKLATGQREFTVNYFNGSFNIFASSDGSNWTNTIAYTPADADKPTLFNGAPRHFAIVKHGSEWSFYICGEKMAGTISVGTIFNGTASLFIAFPGAALVGTIDDYRATYGVARYTATMVTLTSRKFPRS